MAEKRWRDPLVFAGKRPWLLFYTLITALVSYAALLIHSGDVLTDMETYITHTEHFFNDFRLKGRFGLSLTKKLFSTDVYIPAASIWFTCAAMAAACLFIDFAVAETARPEKRGKLEPFYYIFNGLFISCPILIHQIYFSYQAFEVAFAFLLGGMSAFFTLQWARGPKKQGETVRKLGQL